jgi:hypothetical protein
MYSLQAGFSVAPLLREILHEKSLCEVVRRAAGNQKTVEWLSKRYLAMPVLS